MTSLLLRAFRLSPLDRPTDRPTHMQSYCGPSKARATQTAVPTHGSHRRIDRSLATRAPLRSRRSTPHIRSIERPAHAMILWRLGLLDRSETRRHANHASCRRPHSGRNDEPFRPQLVDPIASIQLNPRLNPSTHSGQRRACPAGWRRRHRRPTGRPTAPSACLSDGGQRRGQRWEQSQLQAAAATTGGGGPAAGGGAGRWERWAAAAAGVAQEPGGHLGL